MHLASPTSPAYVTVSSDIMKKSFSATCYFNLQELASGLVRSDARRAPMGRERKVASP
jgi:hypothetical protein